MGTRVRPFKRLRRYIRSRPALRRVSVWAFSSYFGLVYRTTRWSYLGFEDYIRSLEAGTPFITVNWHSRLSMVPYAWDWKTWQMTILSYRHPAADIMSESVRRLGIHVLALEKRGSNTAVLRRAVQAFRAGHCLGITPDGPSGPHMVMKPGAVELAALCGAKLAPVTFSVQRRIVLNTWDRFVVPLPFNRGVFIMGPAHAIARRPSPERRREDMARLEVALTEIGVRADAHFGHAPDTQPRTVAA